MVDSKTTEIPETTSALPLPDARIVLPRMLRPLAIVAVVVAVVLFVVTRGSAPAVVTPSAAPPVLVTPNPHLSTSATAQDVFNGLGHAGLKVTAHTASAGAADGPIVRRIFASYLGWPLDVTEYRSPELLAAAEKWKSGSTPEYGDPPITIAGANMLIIWGPTSSGRAPVEPDARQKAGIQELVSALEVLLSPIRAKSNVPVQITQVAPAPATSAAPSEAPSKAPTAAP
jgi:hypothetical protein